MLREWQEDGWGNLVKALIFSSRAHIPNYSLIVFAVSPVLSLYCYAIHCILTVITLVEVSSSEICS